MSRARGRIICFLIIVMDVAAGILGIEAAIAENKGEYLSVFISKCRAPVHLAFKLGLAAAALLALAHAIANVMGGCTCSCSREGLDRASADKQMAIITLALSWILFVVSFTLLMVGAISNSQPRASCSGLRRHHLLVVGGILCFIHGPFCIAYYVSCAAVQKEEEAKRRREEAHHQGRV